VFAGNQNYRPRQANDGSSTRRAKMHNEERERRDNRPNSVSQARDQQSAQLGARAVDRRIVSPHSAQSATVPPHAAATAKKKPIHLNHDDALRLQLNLSDADEVCLPVDSDIYTDGYL